MKLLHYSREPLGKIRSTKQNAPDWSGAKPSGLWVSVQGDDDWKSWCESESYALENLAFPHVVHLRDDARILRLEDHWSIDDLTRRYGIDRHGHRLYKTMCIDWPRISQEYQGIIIAPYQWSQRMNANWYYGWDCASGCIWDAWAIASVTLMGACAPVYAEASQS